MQFKALIIASVASAAVAQTVTSTTSAATSTGTSTCAAQNILDSCLGTTQGQVNSCQSNDWSCLCAAYETVLTCYNNCPSDPRVGTAQQQREQNCNAASVYGSTTTLGTASATSASSATATGEESAAATGFASGTSTSSGASSSETGNAANTLGAASGLFAMAFAGLAALL